MCCIKGRLDGKIYHSICILRLQINATNHIDPDQALLWSTFWELCELSGWSWNPWVVRKWVNLEGALKNKNLLRLLLSNVIALKQGQKFEDSR